LTTQTTTNHMHTIHNTLYTKHSTAHPHSTRHSPPEHTTSPITILTTLPPTTNGQRPSPPSHPTRTTKDNLKPDQDEAQRTQQDKTAHTHKRSGRGRRLRDYQLIGTHVSPCRLYGAPAPALGRCRVLCPVLYLAGSMHIGRGVGGRVACPRGAL
jgi:hypothetical protein